MTTSDDRLTQIGEMAHGTVRHEDVCWMIDEIERLRNLKGVLMELGNRLVVEHGWEPADARWQRVPAGDHTGLIAGLTQQLNDSQEMRELLGALGFDWPIVEEDE
jgi:hypothetical protein